jgi:hypothetical protein
MKKILTDLYEGIKGSLDTTESGFSARKLTGFAIVSAVIAAHVKWLAIGDLGNLEMVLTIDYGFIAALFGMTTYSAIKSKNGAEVKPNN